MTRMELVSRLIKNKLVLKRGAEIGVWKGDTSDYLLRKHTKIKLICVDPYRLYDHYAKYHHHDICQTQKLYDEMYEKIRNRLGKYGNRVIWKRDLSEDAATTVDDESLDFVFIDGNHGYEYVDKDIKAWLSKIRKGGIMIGHDFGSNKDGPRCVKRAVENNFDSYKVDENDECWYKNI